FAQSTPPLTIFAARDVMDLLMKNVFNGIVWPDFSTVIAPSTNKPVVQYRPLVPGKKVVFNGISLLAVPVDHAIPAAGVVVEMNGQAIVFTGDTGPTQKIWKQANHTPNVVAVVTEASFPND